MNEAAQVLRQTNHERKVTGYGAHHKKGGSAVSKLGNKQMTWQEINSKHGECKEMDPDLEVEYVNKLCEKYRVRHEQVSKYLFELGESDLMARLKINGVDKKIAKIKASDVSDDAIKDFCDQIDFWRQKTEAAKIIDLSEAQRKHDIIENAEFIEYGEFSSFTTDEKVLYLNSLIDKYGVSLASIERELFKLPITNLRHKLYTAGVLKNIKHGATGYAAKAINTAFCNALKTWRGESVMEEKPEAVVEPVKEEPASVTTPEIIGDDKLAEETPVTKSTELPESNISDFYIPVEDNFIDLIPEEPEASKLEETNHHTMVFTSNYRSIGLDSDELEGMKIMCKNKLVEVCITIRTI